MRKKFPLIIVWLIVTGLILYYLINLYQLVAKTYYVDESKLYKVDTFHLLNRAYEQSDNSGGRFSHSYSKLVFESTNGYSFAIDKHIFEAVNDKKKLQDTMMYHDLKFTVFTDKEYFYKYKKYSYPLFIRAYQIQIGDVKYVDIKKMNEITKGYIKRGVLIPPAFIFFFVFLLYKQNQNDNWWTKQRIIIWCIAFVLTTVGLLLLT